MAFSFPVFAAAWLDGGGATAGTDHIYLWIALAIGVVGLLAALLFARGVLASDTGTPEMQLISNAIREGAEAFMKRQYSTIAGIAVALAVVLYIGYRLSPFTAPYANKVVISFLIGAACSALAGQTGMWVSIRANIRTASAARTSMGNALKIALRGGAVTGLVVVGLSLLALFAQLGGGIYTKAADVGADLVGKVEAGIPEDDPRNPAVIADLVGD